MKFRSFFMPAALLLGSAGTIAWLYIAEPPDPEKKPAPPIPDQLRLTDSGQSRINAEGQSQNGVAPAAPRPSDIRDVSPEGISPPSVTGALTRVEPSKEYQDLLNPPVEPMLEGPFDMRRPQVLDAGTLKSDSMLVQIAFIQPLAPDATCLSRLGGTWPCGARARTFLRGLVRMFTVSCEKQEVLGPQKMVAVCTRKTINLGEWLVRYGWADPAEDAPEHYIALANEAKDKKRGKWQAEWLKELPDAALDQSDQDLEDTPLPGEEDILVTPPDFTLPGDNPFDTLDFTPDG